MNFGRIKSKIQFSAADIWQNLIYENIYIYMYVGYLDSVPSLISKFGSQFNRKMEFINFSKDIKDIKASKMAENG
jgi:hypothetical protein